MKEKGYNAELHVVAVPKDVSYVGTLSRYFVGKETGTGRAVNKKHFDESFENLPTTLKALIDSNLFQSMHLHTRDKELFSTDHDKDAFMKNFHREINRRLDLIQSKDLGEKIDKIFKCLQSEEQNGVSKIIETPIAEIRKELQSIQKNRSIGISR